MTLEPIPKFIIFVMEETFKNGFLRARELAREIGISTDTLRHYERKGVLASPRRSRNGYREYPFEAIERVRLVRRALSVGFTLDELSRILQERDKGGAPCREVRALAGEKLSQLERQISEFIKMRDVLRRILSVWDLRLDEISTEGRAGLLESLAHSESPPNGKQSPLAKNWCTQKQRK